MAKQRPESTGEISGGDVSATVSERAIHPVEPREEFVEVCSMGVRSRRSARAAALRTIYALDSIGQATPHGVAELWNYFVNPVGPGDEDSQEEALLFGHSLVTGLIENLLEIDRLIESSSEHWTIARICRVDRNVLRIGVYELVQHHETPVSVIINEAVEIIKAYGAPEAAGFVNGVLDTIARKVRGEPTNDKKIAS